MHVCTLHVTLVITGGIDYFPGPYEVNFPAGVTSASFRILIANDETAERVEKFRLHIRTYYSSYYRVNAYNNTRTTVYIDDDDGKLQIL